MSPNSFSKLSSPEAIEHELIMTGLFLVAYELLRSTVIDQPRSFFVSLLSRDETREKEEAEYRKEVLSLHENKLMASAFWHVKMGALSDEDVEQIREFRDHRNQLAHELPAILVDDVRSVHVELIALMRDLVAKVDRWWILNASPTSVDVADVSLEQVASGSMLLLDHLIATISRLRGGQTVPQ